MPNQRYNDFYNQLEVSPRTKLNYRNAIKSSFVKGVLNQYCSTDNLYGITDLKLLWKVYSFINLHPTNVANHRIHSTAIMKYIRFLNNGERYGRRIDYNKPRPKRK